MIKKQLNQISEFQKYISTLSLDEVVNNLMKEDFFVYDTLYGSKLPFFQKESKPEDKIFNLIQDCELGSYEELQQIETRLNFMTKLPWNHDRTEYLKTMYLTNRRKIVESGLTISQTGLKNIEGSKQAIKAIKKSLNKSEVQDLYIWQFLDSAFKMMDSKQPAQQKCPNQKQNNPQLPKTQQQRQKIKEMKGLYRKLCVLSKPNNDNKLNFEMEVSLKNNQRNNK